MAYSVQLLPSAVKSLDGIPRKQRGQIAEKIGRLASEPFPPTTKKLQGIEDTYRLDSGDYRILYQVQQAKLLVLVVKIGNRKDVHRNLR
jgi:mRNA interferase RelE/StbE